MRGKKLGRYKKLMLRVEVETNRCRGGAKQSGVNRDISEGGGGRRGDDIWELTGMESTGLLLIEGQLVRLSHSVCQARVNIVKAAPPGAYLIGDGGTPPTFLVVSN